MANKKLIGDFNVAGTLSQNDVPLLSNLAADYDPTATYAAGDYCIHAGALYRCAEDISVAEAWNASHWEAAKVGTDLAAAGDIETASILEIRRLFRTEYAITATVLNGSASGDETIWTQETATVTITPDEGYNLPLAIEVTGASYTYDSTTGVVVLSEVTGAVSISATCPEAPPVKGDIISFDALGDGTQKRFRVIDVDSGNTVKLLGLDDLGNSVYNASSGEVVFDNGSSYQNYEGSDLDTYLNTTYYNSLSSDVKSAIVDETLVQSCYIRPEGQSSSAAFNIKRLDIDIVYAYTRTTQRTVGSRHIHAIELDEIKSYFNASTGDLIQGTAINELFFEQTTAISKYVWCASASAANSDSVFDVRGNYGALGNNDYSNSYVVRPAFRIDLSQITYTKE